jgi:hypothetical protein
MSGLRSYLRHHIKEVEKRYEIQQRKLNRLIAHLNSNSAASTKEN